MKPSPKDLAEFQAFEHGEIVKAVPVPESIDFEDFEHGFVINQEAA